VVRARSLRVRDLARYPLVMFREGYDMRTVTFAACRRERIEPRIAVEGGELDAVLAFVEAGVGVAVVPSMVVEGRPGLRRVPFVPPGMSRTIAFAHRRDVDPSATAGAFRSVLLEHLVDAARSGALPRGVEIVGKVGKTIAN
jgi:DNA-binding transcriptional LysR family regulator